MNDVDISFALHEVNEIVYASQNVSLLGSNLRVCFMCRGLCLSLSLFDASLAVYNVTLLFDSPERTTDWQINITDKHTDWSAWTLDQLFTHKMVIRYVPVDDKKQNRWLGTKMPVTQLITTLPYTPEVLYTLPQSLGILNSYSPGESCNAAKKKST